MLKFYLQLFFRCPFMQVLNREIDLISRLQFIGLLLLVLQLSNFVSHKKSCSFHQHSITPLGSTLRVDHAPEMVHNGEFDQEKRVMGYSSLNCSNL